MGNIITFALLGIFLTPVVPTYQNEKRIDLSVHPDSVLCNCVQYLRTHRPDAPDINASEYAVSTTTAYAGAVAVMRYPSGASHVAYVEAVEGDMVLLKHANVIPCKETIEYMSVDNQRILGYM